MTIDVTVRAVRLLAGHQTTIDGVVNAIDGEPCKTAEFFVGLPYYPSVRPGERLQIVIKPKGGAHGATTSN